MIWDGDECFEEYDEYFDEDVYDGDEPDDFDPEEAEQWDRFDGEQFDTPLSETYGGE